MEGWVLHLVVRVVVLACPFTVIHTADDRQRYLITYHHVLGQFASFTRK